MRYFISDEYLRGGQPTLLILYTVTRHNFGNSLLWRSVTKIMSWYCTSANVIIVFLGRLAHKIASKINDFINGMYDIYMSLSLHIRPVLSTRLLYHNINQDRGSEIMI